VNKEVLIDDLWKDNLYMSVRLINCLKNRGFKTLNEVSQCTIKDILRMRNLGRKSLEELMVLLNEYNLTLKQDKQREASVIVIRQKEKVPDFETKNPRKIINYAFSMLQIKAGVAVYLRFVGKNTYKDIGSAMDISHQRALQLVNKGVWIIRKSKLFKRYETKLVGLDWEYKALVNEVLMTSG
jgi:DNA-directed RNA polymerase specialized sigma subunit